jgi:hypothetical protein
MQDSKTLKRRLSVAGLLVILGLFMWLAVQAVQLFPTASSTLASLANSVYNYNPRETRDFSVSGPTTMVNSGDVFDLAWQTLRIPGQYSFYFNCTEGVSANIRSEDRTFTEATCGKSYDLGDINKVEVAFNSDRARFAEVDYNINFYRTNHTNPTASASGTVTIINPDLSLTGEPISTSTSSSATTTLGTTPSTPQEVVTDRSPSTPPRATSTTNVVATSTQARPTTPTSTRPTPQIEYTYTIPVSRPDGFTDLAVSYLGVGSFSSTGQFINTGRIQTFSVGAIQFNVHNLGTRTSETWRYVAELPNGQIYTSPDQAPLKPNERATITLGFPALGDATELARFGVAIETYRDTNTNNNNFVWSTLIVR